MQKCHVESFRHEHRTSSKATAYPFTFQIRYIVYTSYSKFELNMLMFRSSKVAVPLWSRICSMSDSSCGPCAPSAPPPGAAPAAPTAPAPPCHDHIPVDTPSYFNNVDYYLTFPSLMFPSVPAPRRPPRRCTRS